jgi:hypothetical protein
VALPPFGAANASFEVSFAHPGAVAGKVSLAADNLVEDNTRYLAAGVGQAFTVVLVSDADEADWSSPAFYLGRALAPSPQAAPGINLVRRRGQELDRGILETADIFCLVPPVTLSGEAVEIITRRVNEGARLISILDGPAADALLFPALNPPFHLQGTVTSPAGDAVTLGARQRFGELENGDFAAARFHRHFENHPAASRAGETLLAYADGSAALTVSPAGRGSLALVNLPLTPDGGDFAGSPIFPALLHELLWSLRLDSPGAEVAPGAPWMIEAPTAGEGAVTVTGPDGQPVNAEVLASGRVTRLALPPAKTPGIFTVRQAGAAIAYAAVNVDPRESDTRPLAIESLKPGANATVTVQRGGDAAAVGDKPRELWPQLAGAAAGLLALEMALLALWRGAKPTPAAKQAEARA